MSQDHCREVGKTTASLLRSALPEWMSNATKHTCADAGWHLPARTGGHGPGVNLQRSAATGPQATSVRSGLSGPEPTLVCVRTNAVPWPGYVHVSLNSSDFTSSGEAGTVGGPPPPRHPLSSLPLPQPHRTSSPGWDESVFLQVVRRPGYKGSWAGIWRERFHSLRELSG